METDMSENETTQEQSQGLQENRVFQPPHDFAANATVSGMAAYDKLCAEAASDYEGFWARLARENLDWHKPFTSTLDESDAPFYKWFGDGQLNASYNCLDRNLENGNADKTAIIFEADDGAVNRVTYRELHERVCKFANALKSRGIKKGDRVIIYMSMSIEGVAAMQACARIGATHSVVFGGFSAKSLHERIIDAGAVAVITADEQLRGGKQLPLKSIVDEALALDGCEAVKDVIVYRRTGGKIAWNDARDHWLHDEVNGQAEVFAETAEVVHLLGAAPAEQGPEGAVVVDDGVSGAGAVGGDLGEEHHVRVGGKRDGQAGGRQLLREFDALGLLLGRVGGDLLLQVPHYDRPV